MSRPKQFDPDKALDRAMRLFWERGYEATSIQDLVDALGINRFSLYDSFGDKRQLFTRALDHYAERVFERSIAELESGEAGLGAIERYFELLATAAASSLSKRGCLFVNTATELAPRDAAATARLERVYARVEQAFVRALERAHHEGELAAHVQVADAARALVLVAHGSLVSMKTLHDPEWVRAASRSIVLGLRAHTSTNARARSKSVRTRSRRSAQAS